MPTTTTEGDTMTSTTSKRRDELKPGDAFRSSHGYLVYVSRVTYAGDPLTPRDERTVQVHGTMHSANSGIPCTECYPGNSLVQLVVDPTTPAGRWELVRSAFEGRYGPLYADDMHTEPLWEMAEPSVYNVLGGPDDTAEELAAVAAETASRVADAIALLAYGRDAVVAKEEVA